ncbi:unnamed protein product [Prorocentrum cordatum]|uniref:Cellulase n=2 Tax=Prorocentrum cordatum TaxID=2364126 RepID=A0ABN9TIP6_9DINO|nr:unnamed protein product [Polarella glacialis]
MGRIWHDQYRGSSEGPETTPLGAHVADFRSHFGSGLFDASSRLKVDAGQLLTSGVCAAVGTPVAPSEDRVRGSMGESRLLLHKQEQRWRPTATPPVPSRSRPFARPPPPEIRAAAPAVRAPQRTPRRRTVPRSARGSVRRELAGARACGRVWPVLEVDGPCLVGGLPREVASEFRWRLVMFLTAPSVPPESPEPESHVSPTLQPRGKLNPTSLSDSREHDSQGPSRFSFDGREFERRQGYLLNPKTITRMVCGSQFFGSESVTLEALQICAHDISDFRGFSINRNKYHGDCVQAWFGTNRRGRPDFGHCCQQKDNDWYTWLLYRPQLDDFGQSLSGLQNCQGDCDSDSDCEGALKCFHRDGYAEVPGCDGTGRRNWDYCYEA